MINTGGDAGTTDRELLYQHNSNRHETNARIEVQKDFGNIDDDDIVNQNSSHDGRSH